MDMRNKRNKLMTVTTFMVVWIEIFTSVFARKASLVTTFMVVWIEINKNQ